MSRPDDATEDTESAIRAWLDEMDDDEKSEYIDNLETLLRDLKHEHDLD